MRLIENQGLKKNLQIINNWNEHFIYMKIRLKKKKDYIEIKTT